MVNELNLLFHTIFIALADHGDDEIHEDNVPDDQNQEPEEPCEEFEFCRALNNGRGIVVTNGLTQNNHEKSCQLDSNVLISRFLDNDLGHYGEKCNHKQEVKEKDKELIENIDQHSYQEADFSPDSYQKTELDKTENHND